MKYFLWLQHISIKSNDKGVILHSPPKKEPERAQQKMG